MRSTLTAALLLCATAAARADDAAAKFLKELEGSYTPSSVSRGGEALPAAELEAIAAVTIKGDKLTLKFKKDGKEAEHSAVLVVDPGQKPVAIDMTPTDGPDANKPVLGIVKAEKDTVTLCWSDRKDGTQRPKDFTSTKENKQFLIVLKRGK